MANEVGKAPCLRRSDCWKCICQILSSSGHLAFHSNHWGNGHRNSTTFNYECERVPSSWL